MPFGSDTSSDQLDDAALALELGSSSTNPAPLEDSSRRRQRCKLLGATQVGHQVFDFAPLIETNATDEMTMNNELMMLSPAITRDRSAVRVLSWMKLINGTV